MSGTASVVRPRESRKTRQISLPKSYAVSALQPLEYHSINLSPNNSSYQLSRSTALTAHLVSAVNQKQDDLHDRISRQAQNIQLQIQATRDLHRENIEQIRRQQTLEQERAVAEQLEWRRHRLEEARRVHAFRQEQIERERAEKIVQISRRNEELEREWLIEQERRRAQEAAEHEARGVAELVRQQEAEEAERRRQERLRECEVCMDAADMDQMIETPCSHWYCQDDISSAFQAALNGHPRQPFQCCGQNVPFELCPNPTPDFRERYERMFLERTTVNPVYCANRMCGQFIPPARYRGPDHAVCEACEYTTCRLCRNPGHANICPQDVQTQQAEQLATQMGWRRCHNCRHMVEKQSGCNHMTCICGSEFCYVCGNTGWRNCGHTG